MLDAKKLLTKVLTDIADLKDNATTKSPTPTVTASKGTLYSAAARKYGNIVHLRITVQNSSTTATSQNIFEGMLTTTSLQPQMTTTGIGYFGARPVVGQVTGAGAIIIRNTNPDTFPALTGTSTLAMQFIYIV